MRTTRYDRPAWVEGVVNQASEHIQICYGERRMPVARVTRDANKEFVVEFLVSKRMTQRLAGRILEEVRRELDFYLLGAIGPDSWAFAQYHCDTAANMCAVVHWRWQPKHVS